MIIFRPHKSREIYFKQHLHSDEFSVYVCGLPHDAIAENKNGAEIYMRALKKLPKLYLKLQKIFYDRNDVGLCWPLR